MEDAPEVKIPEKVDEEVADEETSLAQPRIGGQLAPGGKTEIVMAEKSQEKKRVAVGKLVNQGGKKVIQITSDPAFRKRSSS
jgi:hypothetical protein